jgi:hypothetical protein
MMRKLCWADIDFYERLGSRVFSDVYSVRVVNRDHSPGNAVPCNPYHALKCVRGESLKDIDNEFFPNSVNLAIEAAILSKLDHRNIIRVLGSNDATDPLILKPTRVTSLSWRYWRPHSPPDLIDCEVPKDPFPQP